MKTSMFPSIFLGNLLVSYIPAPTYARHVSASSCRLWSFCSGPCTSAKLSEWCLTLCNPRDCNPPGSPVHGIFQARIWSGLPFPSPEDLPEAGIEPASLISPALVGAFFTTSALFWPERCKKL